MVGHQKKAQEMLIGDIAKVLNGPPQPGHSSPTLDKRLCLIFWLVVACTGLAQLPLMLNAMRSGFGYTYVIGWVTVTQLLWAAYYMLAGLRIIPYISRSPLLETIALGVLFYALPLYIICATAFNGGFEHSHAVEIVRANEDMIRYLVTTSFFNDADLTNAVDRFYDALIRTQDLPTIDALFSIYMMPLVKISLMIAILCQTLLMPLPLTRAPQTSGYWPVWRIVLSAVFIVGMLLTISYPLLHPLNGVPTALYNDKTQSFCYLFLATPMGLAIPTAFRFAYNRSRAKKAAAASAGIDVPQP